nr:hypothetical protein [Tanacetum cinerariifolium]
MKSHIKAGKLLFPRFTKLIITHIMSNNNTINQTSNVDMCNEDMDEKFKPTKVTKRGFIHYGLPIPDTLLNDTIRDMDAYKENVENSKEKSTLKDKPVKEKRVKEKSKKAKETYVDGPDLLHVAILLSTESKRLRLERIEREQRMINEEIDDDLDDTLEAMIETQELRDSLDSDQTHSATRLDVVDEGDEDDASNFKVFVHGKQYDVKEKETTTHTTINSSRTRSSQENISCYLDETYAPSLEDVGLPRIARKSGLNSHDGSFGKEKPRGDSVDLDRLRESQTLDVQKVNMSEPTRPDQRGFTRVDYVLITLDETLTLELPARGNPELTSYTSGASENPSDVLAQNLNFQSSSRNDQVVSETSDHDMQPSSARKIHEYPRWLDGHHAKYTNYAWVTRSSEEDMFNEVVDTYQDPDEPEDREIVPDSFTLTFAKTLKRCLDVDKLNLSKLKEFKKYGYELFGNRFMCKVDKEPLSLVGPKLIRRIPLEHFFNEDLEYLKNGNKDLKQRKLFKRTLVDYDVDAMLEIHHWGRMKRLAYRGKRATTIVGNVYANLKITFIAAVKVDLICEYGFLESITVTRVDKKKYTFMESDFFGQLNLNEIEDMHVLKA